MRWAGEIMPKLSCDPTQTAAVLIVDGVESSRAFVRATLSGLPLNVEEADDGGTAFERLLTRRFDLLITDLYTGPIDGVKLVLAAGLLQADRRPRTMICSPETHSFDTAQQQAMRVADKIIAKPIDPEGLVAAVTELLA